MKKYAFTFRDDQSFSGTVTRHNFLIRCMPGTYPFQRTYAHKLTVRPYTALTHSADVFGNEMYTGAVDKAHTDFSFESSGFVLCSKYLIREPLDRLYLYPTTLTTPTEQMHRILASASLSEDPWRRAMQLCDLTHRSLTLTPRISGVRTPAAKALSAGHGDARAQAHVLMTLCRLSGIAARFVSGLALGVDTAHCWVEVYCGSLWRALDPTTGAPVEEGYLKIAHGPDYNACSLERGVFRAEEDGVTATNHLTVQVTEHVITTRDTVPHA